MTESREAVGAPAETAADADPTATSDTGGDFADEHGSASFADQLEGGPEAARESESPVGLAGADN